MHFHFLRHATFLLSIGSINILVDPMLSAAEAMPPVANAANQRPIPMIDLPVDDNVLLRLLSNLDLVLVTHHHRDHWDARAVELLPKTLPILTQPESETAIRQAGFSTVVPVQTNWTGNSFDLLRTGGHHGTGEIGQQMGAVSGFVIRSAAEPSLYIAGDTIWCEEVETTLREQKPDIVVLNAGAAQFLTGDPITMTADDVCQVCRTLPAARVIAVHMETVNHCGLTRNMLRSHLAAKGLGQQVMIPADGEEWHWGNA